MITNTEVLRPKRRSRSGLASEIETDYELRVAVSPITRPPRMKRSGHPHQVWATPELMAPETIQTVPVAPVVHEIVGLFARACLQPLQSYYSR
jgi:hypothetical protein